MQCLPSIGCKLSVLRLIGPIPMVYWVEKNKNIVVVIPVCYECILPGIDEGKRICCVALNALVYVFPCNFCFMVVKRRRHCN